MIVLWLCVYLHASQYLVEKVYLRGGLDDVAVVTMESQWNPHAFRYERDRHGKIIGTSYGLQQLFDRYHPQYRNDLDAHIREGVDWLSDCKMVETVGLDFSDAVAIYNGGWQPGKDARSWGLKVQAKRDELARWLWWRWVKSEQVAM